MTEEIKVYTQQDHVEKATNCIAELHVKFELAITILADYLIIIPKKQYIAFKRRRKTIVGLPS